VLADDRHAYYAQTPGTDHQENEERVSSVKALGVDVPVRPRGLRDMDKAFDMYLREQLQKDRDYKGSVALNHSLVLLEYSSPVLADVVKHYRMSTYERLGIEQARLAGIDRATEGRRERLSRQSEWECLQRNENKGLVAAMRSCQNSIKPLENLIAIEGGGSLQDGRRKIHVVREALSRLGFDKARIDNIVEITGEKVLSNDRFEERLPESTFERRVVYARQTLIRKWREVLEKFRTAGRVASGSLEGLSLPGVPVTSKVLEDISLLDVHESDVTIFKLSSRQAFVQTERTYQQAVGYLDLCLRDPALVEEFRRIIEEKRSLLLETLTSAQKDRAGDGAYKDLVASVADTADVVRERLRQSLGKTTGGALSTIKRELMVDF
jgi:hypothetical protein